MAVMSISEAARRRCLSGQAKKVGDGRREVGEEYRREDGRKGRGEEKAEG